MTSCQLLIGASEHDTDMLYISGMFVPDPFIAIGIENIWHGMLSPLEVDRARKQSSLHHIHLDTDWRQKAEQLGFGKGLAATAAAFLQEHHIQNIVVPGHFPFIHAERLRELGFTVTPSENSLFPERLYKKEKEIIQLSRAEKLTRQAMQQAEHFLAECEIDAQQFLHHPTQARKLKAADLRLVIDSFLISHGAMPSHTIVACGKQGADPHNVGHGYLRAHQPIIIDIFPRLMNSGYWGDMTRTYVKGQASTEVKRMYQAVREAQDIGLSMVADGVASRQIHQSIQQHFDRCGFHTGLKRGQQCGFFHGTGHGVGLDIHEAPRISLCDDILQTGQVVTVEPGLYYPHIGGIRIEDMVVVRDDGCDNLTRHRRQLEIT